MPGKPPESQNNYRDEQTEIEDEARKQGEALAKSYAEYERATGGYASKSEQEGMVSSHIESARSNYHHDRAQADLEEYSTQWIRPDYQKLGRDLSRALENAQSEEDMQRFLTENKELLVRHLGGGHGRYVIPKPKLGSECIPDYLIAEMSSIGIEWHGIELEHPSGRLYNMNGQLSAPLNHAIQQIRDWRGWLTSNISYARSSKSENGLGLVGIDGNIPATILMGRRKEFPASFNIYRRQIKDRENIEIHTYDWLVERAGFSPIIRGSEE